MIGPILCAVLSIYDGDTLTVRCEIWPTFEVTTSVRVRGIDAPEIRGKCAKERNAAILAREAVREMTTPVVGGPDMVELHNIKLGKYAGRVVADIVAGGRNVGQALVADGLARPYDGKTKRQGWCAGRGPE